MWAPPDAVDALAQLLPTARWGWLPADPQPGEINAGCYVLLQLVEQRSLRGIPNERWLGPVFGKRWDRDRWAPVVIAQVPVVDVFSGRWIVRARRWMTSMRERMRESLARAGRNYNAKIDDVCEEIGDYAWWHGQHSPHGPRQVANKFRTKRDERAFSGEGAKPLRPAYSPRIPL